MTKETSLEIVLASIELGNEIGFWLAKNGDQNVTVNDMSLHFMKTPDKIRQAVDEHYYLFLRNDEFIEMDGE